MKNWALTLVSILVVATASACVVSGEEPVASDDAAYTSDEDVGSHESELLSTCSFRNQIGVFAADEYGACTAALLEADRQCRDQSGLPCCQVSGKSTFRGRGLTWCEYRRYMWTDF